MLEEGDGLTWIEPACGSLSARYPTGRIMVTAEGDPARPSDNLSEVLQRIGASYGCVAARVQLHASLQVRFHSWTTSLLLP